jgi:hypothetical protein
MKDSELPQNDPLSGAQACIVWHPSHRAPSRTLLRALGNKGLTIIAADDVHAAIASAQRASRSADRTIVVLDTLPELHDVDRLVSSIERFLPRALCWSHEPGANPPLVPLVQPKKRTPTPSMPATHHKPAPLKLVGQDPEPDVGPGRMPSNDQGTQPHADPTPMSQSPKPAPTLSARDVLDAEELDALLASEVGDRKQ